MSKIVSDNIARDAHRSALQSTAFDSIKRVDLPATLDEETLTKSLDGVQKSVRLHNQALDLVEAGTKEAFSASLIAAKQSLRFDSMDERTRMVVNNSALRAADEAAKTELQRQLNIHTNSMNFHETNYMEEMNKLGGLLQACPTPSALLTHFSVSTTEARDHRAKWAAIVGSNPNSEDVHYYTVKALQSGDAHLASVMLSHLRNLGENAPIPPSAYAERFVGKLHAALRVKHSEMSDVVLDLQKRRDSIGANKKLSSRDKIKSYLRKLAIEHEKKFADGFSDDAIAFDRAVEGGADPDLPETAEGGGDNA